MRDGVSAFNPFWKHRYTDGKITWFCSLWHPIQHHISRLFSKQCSIKTRRREIRNVQRYDVLNRLRWASAHQKVTGPALTDPEISFVLCTQHWSSFPLPSACASLYRLTFCARLFLFLLYMGLTLHTSAWGSTKYREWLYSSTIGGKRVLWVQQMIGFLVKTVKVLPASVVPNAMFTWNTRCKLRARVNRLKNA